ncbi:MAG: hypothetical protein NXI18_06705 [Alphaproteobacteria bacterium]|nr:hypothetical protein [Alphaproteobacteria bacterium]
MTTIEDATDRIGGVSVAAAASSDAVFGAGAISQEAIDRGVNRGRRLRAQAFGHAFVTVGGWIVGTARAAVGRRATTRLGCDECGDMMRA